MPATRWVLARRRLLLVGVGIPTLLLAGCADDDPAPDRGNDLEEPMEEAPDSEDPGDGDPGEGDPGEGEPGEEDPGDEDSDQPEEDPGPEQPQFDEPDLAAADSRPELLDVADLLPGVAVRPAWTL